MNSNSFLLELLQAAIPDTATNLTPLLRNSSDYKTPRTIPSTIIKGLGSMTIYAEMPGFKKEDIKINCFNNKLIVRGKKNIPYPSSTPSSSVHSTAKYGDYEMVCSMPVSITSQNSIKKNYENGVLYIEIDFEAEEKKNSFEISL